MDEMLTKFQKDCDDFVERVRREKTINEEFRYQMLKVFNGLNALVPELLTQVTSLIEGIKDSTISSILMEQRLKELNKAATIITTRTQAVQSSIAYSNTYKRNGEFDEHALLYMMVNTMNDIVGQLINMVGNLTVEYSNSILQEHVLTEALNKADQR